jgi:hypothetical protein
MASGPQYKNARMQLRMQITRCYENFDADNCRKARDSIKELQRLNAGR